MLIIYFWSSFHFQVFCTAKNNAEKVKASNINNIIIRANFIKLTINKGILDVFRQSKEIFCHCSEFSSHPQWWNNRIDHIWLSPLN